MILTLDIVSDSPTLNAFTLSKSTQFVKGQTAVINLRIWQSDKGIRYIPSSSAVLTIDLYNADNTILTKTLTSLFADDRSIQQFTLSSDETVNIIGQSLIVKITDGSNIYFAVLQKGLQKVILDGAC